MIILKQGMSFGRIRFNQGKGVINPRLPQILVFKLTSFTVLSYLETSYPRVLYLMFPGFLRKLPKMYTRMKVNLY